MKPIYLLPLLCGLLMPALRAEEAATGALSGQQVTVRELMQLDAELALESARRRRGLGAEPGSPRVAKERPAGAGGAMSDELKLLGIYGVGQRLFAEIRSGRQRYLYLRGQPHPVGHAAAHDGYRLKSLAGSCVRLLRSDEETELCLSRPGGD